MNRSFALFFSLSALLSLAVGCAAQTADSADDDAAEEEVDSSEEAIVSGTPSNFGYYVVTRRDMNRCAAPNCGGFFVKRVNETKTRCANGKLADECYVSSIALNGIGLSAREESEVRGAVESGTALFKARQYKKTSRGVIVGSLKANEAWLAATGSALPDGMVFRAADNGIRCITTPCPSVSAYTLNTNDAHNVIDVVLDQTNNVPDHEIVLRAQEAIASSKDGILIAGGLITPRCVQGATNCGPKVIASEFYLRYIAREGKSCGGHTINGNVPCNTKQYCNWKPADICGAADATGVCSYRPDVCITLYKPVCGCDGETYTNACRAASAGVSVSKEGACTN